MASVTQPWCSMVWLLGHPGIMSIIIGNSLVESQLREHPKAPEHPVIQVSPQPQGSHFVSGLTNLGSKRSTPKGPALPRQLATEDPQAVDNSLLNSRQGMTSAKWPYLPRLWLSLEWVTITFHLQEGYLLSPCGPAHPGIGLSTTGKGFGLGRN